MKKTKSFSKRRNKNLALDELVGGIIDPLLRKRGFASSEIVDRWHAIAPPPYNAQSVPDALKWGRNDESGTLILRCSDGLKLMLTHDAPLIIGAVNRYFGYVLIDKIKLSVSPFMMRSASPTHTVSTLDREQENWIDTTVGKIEDPDLDAALRKLGAGIAERKKRPT